MSRHGDHGDSKSNSSGSSRGGARNPGAFAFAPYEIAVVGFSGAGKTTLVTSLIEWLKSDYSIGFVKHDAHRFQMDKEGKDTWRAKQAGAAVVAINARTEYAIIGQEESRSSYASSLWSDVDIVLVEGYKYGSTPKLVVVDDRGEILDEVGSDVGEVVGYVVHAGLDETLLRRTAELAGRDVPVFDRDDLEAIAGFIRLRFEQQTAAIPVYGLVLSGGHSTRMKRDKASLVYNGQPQVRIAAELLSRHAERVFVSVRADQAADPVYDGLATITDRFIGFGPMGGMLTAFHEFPEAAWIVVGCDLPFVNDETIAGLLRARNPHRLATCYRSAVDGLAEPLCALYEPAYVRRLHQYMADGRTCPRKVLINTRSTVLDLADSHALDNINTPEQYEEALRR